MNIIPLGDRIIVRRLAPDSGPRQTNGTSDPARDRPERGVVIAVGSGTPGRDGTEIPLAVTAGDTIVFGRHAAEEITVGGVQYWILKADQVLTIEVSAAPLWTRRT
jgi:chaperonin GroES